LNYNNTDIKISVCIPTFNQSDYIEKSIRSALKQTVRPFEIIVSNDASTDSTVEVLDVLQREVGILRVIHQPFNLGISKNTNACLRMATGDYIVRLDSDDMLLPDYIEILSNLLIEYPDAGYAHAAVEEIDKSGRLLNQRKLFRKAVFQNGDEALKAALKGYRVAANIIMFRRNALETVNYITCKENFAEDYFLSVNIAAAGFGNVYSNNILSNYRVWEDVGKVRQKRKLSEIKGLNSVFKDALKPAFVARNWDLKSLNNSMASFANIQAACLGWDIYSDGDKIEIENAILELSGSKKTKILIWVFKNGFGHAFSYYTQLKGNLRQFAKASILSLQKHGK